MDAESKETAVVATSQTEASPPAPSDILAGGIDVVDRASQVARRLADIVEQQQLYVVLRGQRYIRVDGWTTLGAMLGVVAREVSVEERDDGEVVATVELVHIPSGRIVSRASGSCGRADEYRRDGGPVWASRPIYARRSMALTRATGKAFRMAFGWIVTLSGFASTPAEDMDGLEQPEPAQQYPQRAEPQRTPGQRPRQRAAAAAAEADATTQSSRTVMPPPPPPPPSQPSRRERMIARCRELEDALGMPEEERAMLDSVADDEIEAYGRLLADMLRQRGGEL